MCGESWLTIKDILPTVPVLKAGHSSVLFIMLIVCSCFAGVVPLFSSSATTLAMQCAIYTLVLSCSYVYETILVYVPSYTN